ncbi:MAG: CvpA family protein [Pelagibacterales bacterium]|nr:CvpA family protein [Pelagibacterales bacterium]MDG2268140.1 CvpA family protein [Alphaproteobacteria bacterium]
MDFSNLDINALDIILFISIIISIIIGYTRGLIRETLSIFNWLFASWFSFRYYSDLKIILRDVISPEILADALSFGLLFLFIIIAITMISNFICKNIKKSLLGPIDKILGMIFGAFRAFILILVLVIAGNQIIWVNNTTPSLLSKAYAYPMIILGIQYIEKLFPKEILTFNYDLIDIKKLNLKNIIDKNKLFEDPPVNKNVENEGSYTPAEREQMDRLNNIETIDTESSN